MTTITASTTVGIDLNPAFYTSPVVIGAGVTVSNTGHPDAVYRHTGATTFFVIDNNGAITGSSIGVYLAPGGSVTNASSAGIEGVQFGVEISGGAGTVVNDGGIYGRGSGELPTDGTGVYLLSGGSVTNASSAGIEGVQFGVEISGGAGTVVNDGGIFSRAGGGLALPSGGSVTNASHGYIQGAAGVAVSRGTVVNDGSILGGILLGGFLSGSAGVFMGSGGSVTNSPSGSITGARVGVDLSGGATLTNAGSISGGIYGVYVHGGGTLTNAGSIIGSSGTAVYFAGAGSNLLVLDAGFGFSGIVAGGTYSGNSSIELASGSSTGTVTGLGTQFTRFGTIAFDPGAQWFASGVQSGLAGPISGFAQGDTIELTGDTAIGSSFVTGVLTLDLASGGSATLDLPGPFTLASFEVNNVAAGADITVIPCFCAGTHIATPRGEIRVEALREHDLVVLARGRRAPIVWVGRRHIDCRRHAHAADILPVRVRAGAFGERLPARDLLLSPDHAVFVGDVLVPVRHLINGSTVVQEQVDEVTYCHVELATHDVVLAEGLPCESYLDTGNRAAFEDGSTTAVAVASA